jgi:aspartyl protease family protein
MRIRRIGGRDGAKFVYGPLKAIILAGIIAGLVVAVQRHGGVSPSLDSHDPLSLVYQVGLLILVGGAGVRLFSGRLGEALQAAMMWIVVALLLIAGYTYRFELNEVTTRMMMELAPGRTVLARGQVVEVARTGSGEFQILTTVNDARVPMVLDTGASTVMLTRDAALAAGLPVELIKYTINIETANGRTRAAAATVDRIAVGNIVETAVPALIAQPGALKTSLLGMSFLSRLESWEVRGGKVIMHGAP